MDDEALHPNAITLLRAFANFDTVCPGMLGNLDTLRGLDETAMRNAIRSLSAQALIKPTTEGTLAAFTSREYRITPRGRRTLRRLQDSDASRIALPRKVDMGTTWHGRWLTIPARPGALDAFALPSLRGEERIPHIAPISMAAPRTEKRR